MVNINWTYERDGIVCTANSNTVNEDGYHLLIDNNSKVQCIILIRNNVVAKGATEEEALDNYTSGNVERLNQDTSMVYFD